MDYPKFSVLMSLYYKEKPEFFSECVNSLVQQTVLPTEIVIVFDGPLTEELYTLVDQYISDYPGLIKTINRPKNEGLGIALAAGIPECSYELIARMDTDDIARKDRFEKQLTVFMSNPDLDICGSNIDEFEDEASIVVAHRKVPEWHNDIIEYQKRRDSFNHMTVMFKKAAVLTAGNYQDCPLMEDSYLWARMIMNGAHCYNIQESLVTVRIGNGMFARRGGFKYFLKYAKGRTMIFMTGYISVYDLLLTLFVQLFVSMIPNFARGYLYRHFLHK